MAAPIPPAAALVTLSPSAACDALADMPTATSSIGTITEDVKTVEFCAVVRDMGAEPPSLAVRLLTRAAAHAFAGRLHAAVRVWASFLARSSPIARAARRDVRLAARGGRGEERGRDARAIGLACRGACFSHVGALISRDPVRL